MSDFDPPKACGAKHVGNYDMGLMVDDTCELHGGHIKHRHVGKRFTWVDPGDIPAWQKPMSAGNKREAEFIAASPKKQALLLESYFVEFGQ